MFDAAATLLTPPPAVSLRNYLRAATQPQHRVVDARFAGFLAEGETGYGRFLLGLAEGVFPLEQALADAGVATVLMDWHRRARSDALAADLADLGLPEPAAADPPPIRGEACIFGVLYVLEGSRLGAAILRKHLAAHPSARVRGADRYLCHGDSGFWRSFIAALDRSEAAQRNPMAVTAGARLAFAMFGAPAAVSARKAAADAG